MRKRPIDLLAGLLLVLLTSALPQSTGRTEPAMPCTTALADPEVLFECLGAQLKASEHHLAVSFAASRVVIAGQIRLPASQRQRWSGLLEEAQARFINWRDFECQGVAPYESADLMARERARSDLAALAERLRCLIHANEMRTADLARRYPPAASDVDAAESSKPTAPAAPLRATANVTR